MQKNTHSPFLDRDLTASALHDSFVCGVALPYCASSHRDCRALSQGPTHSSFIMPGRVGPAFNCEAFENYGHSVFSPVVGILEAQFSTCYGSDLPVGKTTLAYSPLGTEVMSIPQNPKVL